MRNASAYVLASLGCLVLACGARAPLPVALEKTLRVDTEANAVLGIVDHEESTFIASADRIDVYRGDISIASALAPTDSTWTSVARVDALDGEGTWIVATDGRGGIWRISEDGRRMLVGDRLAVDLARSILAAGSTIAVVLDRAIAIADGTHVRRYPVWGLVAVGPNRLARATEHDVELWNLVAGTRRHFAIRGAKHLAFFREQLIVGTTDALFVETPDGLHPIPVAGLRDVAVADKLWVLASRLYTIEGTALVPSTVDVSDVRELFGTGSSLWLARAGSLERYDAARSGADREWIAQVSPVFRRACAGCHLPGGTADVDLSSPAAWHQLRAEIRERVIVERSMPPSGTEISDADRQTLASWLGTSR